MDKQKPKRPSWAAWLGFRFESDPRQIPWLGPIIGFFIACTVFLVIVAAIAVFGHFIAALFHVGSYDQANAGEAIRNLGLVVAAIFGAPFLVWRSIVLAKQTDIAEASLLNEKISSAAEGLRTRREPSLLVNLSDDDDDVFKWEDDIIARIVAIDQMYGVAIEAPSTSPRIVKLLAAYVRTNFPTENTTPTENIELARIPRMDLQKAVETIGELMPKARSADPSAWRLDLSSCNFDGVDFSNGCYFAADLSKSRFEAAIFDAASFTGAIFSRSLLNYASFTNADMTGAKFHHVTLSEERGGGAFSLAFAELTGASFIGANISGVSHIKAEKLRQTFGTLDTQLSTNLNDKRRLGKFNFSQAHEFATFREADSLSNEEAEAVRRLKSGPFSEWSPYDSKDLITGQFLREFYAKISLDRWPFI